MEVGLIASAPRREKSFDELAQGARRAALRAEVRFWRSRLAMVLARLERAERSMRSIDGLSATEWERPTKLRARRPDVQGALLRILDRKGAAGATSDELFALLRAELGERIHPRSPAMALARLKAKGLVAALDGRWMRGPAHTDANSSAVNRA